ncbi:MAG: hypothetical protein PHO10_03470 [Gemmiger sp.]|nr:hypothetical protein [Gemmiger sp.]
MKHDQTIKAALWVAAGGYLLYTAWQLFCGAAAPGGLLLVAAVGFGIGGAVILVVGLRRMQRVATAQRAAPQAEDSPEGKPEGSPENSLKASPGERE